MIEEGISEGKGGEKVVNLEAIMGKSVLGREEQVQRFGGGMWWNSGETHLWEQSMQEEER